MSSRGEPMTLANSIEMDRFLQLLKARDERILLLERQLTEERLMSSSDAREWRRLQRDRDQLAEWLVDQALNGRGESNDSPIDAGLKCDPFVPSQHTFHHQDRRYRMCLLETAYAITEVMDEPL